MRNLFIFLLAINIFSVFSRDLPRSDIDLYNLRRTGPAMAGPVRLPPGTSDDDDDTDSVVWVQDLQADYQDAVNSRVDWTIEEEVSSDIDDTDSIISREWTDEIQDEYRQELLDVLLTHF
ncbi:hypothetical protein BVRB_029740 [Beta vulgaris subsp. vulgaris]|uniref:Uncharacterized protein n=1 Tax=Beta vulgaris subsp. vulgaris TaxID=3555 RepID=A0A0J8DSA5_BETVV|nr:hypothetical protein BVRB_029740 [Beta vulgaris subsp. vulgaris]